MKFLFLFGLLISQVYAQTRSFDGFYTLEIKLIGHALDSLVINGMVHIRDTMSKCDFYVAPDSTGFAKVALPANKVYELTSTRDDYYDSEPIWEYLNSDNRKIVLSNQLMDVSYSMPFSKFDRVFFSKGASDINPEMKIILDSFCNAVSFYKRLMVFEVAGNTRMSRDDKGDFELSEQRAKEVSQYLKLRTFNCVFVPSGQSHYKLLNDCTNKKCSEKDLLENDRVEIRFMASRKMKIN